MDFPLQSCIVPTVRFPLLQALELQELTGDFTCVILDLQRLGRKVEQLGEAEFAGQFFGRRELEYLAGITSAKRRQEWLGGRLAARLAAARLLSRQGRPLAWSALHVMADKNGRPFLHTAGREIAVPDISISHSGSLAAAMAVSKGLCGIDIQQVTSRVIKVRERFCTTAEARLLQKFWRPESDAFIAALTLLWAAKETLRKAANQGPPPGFLALELAEIGKRPSYWNFWFNWNNTAGSGHAAAKQWCVAAALAADYALALTTRNDTVAASTP